MKATEMPNILCCSLLIVSSSLGFVPHHSLNLTPSTKNSFIARNSIEGGNRPNRFLKSKHLLNQAKGSKEISNKSLETSEDLIYGSDDTPAEKTGSAPMEAGVLVDPFDKVRIQHMRNQPGSGRSMFFSSLAVIGVVIGSVYFTGKAYYTRQESLVEAFSQDMVELYNSEKSMAACTKEYKRRLGPGQFRSEMFAAFVTELSKKKPISCQTMKAVKLMKKKLRFSDAKAAKVLANAGENVSRRLPGIRSKLLFYAEKLSPNPSKRSQKSLKKLRDLLTLTYGSGGEQIVTAAQTAMAEQAIRESAGDGDELPEGYELLGVSEERCKEILAEMKESSIENLKAMEKEEESERQTEALLEKNAKEKVKENEGTNKNNVAYECEKCGYTLFVAKGREWKFFAESYKCPECGAGRAHFVEKQVGDMKNE
mmetsp:Transcript_16588/g.23446  ORF Transcript_16588/g.23446 Transcript_16588/m.23446 type:complete len:425 (+) Transcript_16588:82-1356(+)|eukprot:CAMPEP_0171461394 /NCGR_PEP_ID=MMETSP0945-20130129/5860_1 /TAXON_ID=109269 /ORGANISM="Vaucheria litorea, Strain CCMP2940" /LENGTH=424 /DNA_ID=CAMNT_0011987733 /DNA_START=60 /DNA_END=1334 /DNA_ORIENTATION=-